MSGDSSNRREFPPDFLFGAATASHQVEGGNNWNDWWEYEQSRQLPFLSGNACEQYSRFENDFELAKMWGHNCHRISIEWSRIEPQSGIWNSEATDHYKSVVNALTERGLEPVVTLNHFTLPAWFLRRGGWLSNDSPAIFARFVEHVIEHLGRSVTLWLTINEPIIYVQQAYINGEWPPMSRQAWWSASKALCNLARAHNSAYRAIKQRANGAQVGFAHSAMHVMPCDRHRIMDRLSSVVRDYFLNRLIFKLIGVNPDSAKDQNKNIDFVGLNYYTRCCVKFGGIRPSGILGRACKLNHHENTGYQSDLGLESYPMGLMAEIKRYSKYGLPILITENGIATRDDRLRRDYLRQHLRVVADSLAAGLPVIGYLHWSLIDNFEWNHGTGPQYGLAEVDYATQERFPRESAAVFSTVCRTGRVK